MPVKWSWYDESQRIALVEYEGNVSVQEVADILQSLIDEADNGPMYYISYQRETQVPVGVIKEKVARTFMSHPNNRYIAFAPLSPIAHYMLQVLARGKGSGHKTLEDAIKVAEERASRERAGS